MSFVRLIIGFVSYIVKGVLISVITSLALFIIGLSVVTQKFPPDLSSYQEKINEVQIMLKNLNQVAGASAEPLLSAPGTEKLVDTEEMIRVHENKMKMGREVAGVIAPLAQSASQLETKIEFERMRHELDTLKSRMNEIENQLSNHDKNHSN